MVSLNLHDCLVVEPDGDGVEVVASPGARAEELSVGADNIVVRALAAAGRSARVRIEKRIPLGGGLGGGSTDAGAVLRWAGVDDPAVAARLGGDVPFCLRGGRAMVRGIGEQVMPLPYEPRAFVLLVPPFGVDTAAVYRAWDARSEAGGLADLAARRVNELTLAAVDVEPRLAAWGEALAAATGRSPVLAGSGSTWWVEGTPEEVHLAGRQTLTVGRAEGRLIPVRTVPAAWAGPGTRNGASVA